MIKRNIHDNMLNSHVKVCVVTVMTLCLKLIAENISHYSG